MALYDVYLRNKKQRLPPLLTLILIVLLSGMIIYSKRYYLSMGLTIIISICSMLHFKKYYITILKFFLIAAGSLSLLTLNHSIMFLTFWKILGYGHLTLLFCILCPPTSLKNKAVKTCLVFMPYFEKHTLQIVTAARIKGVKVKTKNPILFTLNGAKLIIPIIVILVSTMEEVINALRIKGY